MTFTGYDKSYSLSSGTMTVGGTLTLGDTYNNAASVASLNSGTILANGDVVFNNYGYFGSASIKIAGSGNQSVSGVGNSRIPKLEIASSGGTVSVSGTLAVLGNYTYTSGVVSWGTSTLQFGNGSDGWLGTYTIIPGVLIYGNVSFKGFNKSYTLSGGTMAVAGTLTVGDSYSMPGSLSSGTILAQGDVVFNNYGYYGSAWIKLAGSGNQNISGITNSRLPNLEILSTGGTINVSGTLVVLGNFTYTSGVVNWGTATLQFGNGSDGWLSSLTVIPGILSYGNVTFAGHNTNYSLAGGTMTINGSLSMGDTYGIPGSFNNGNIVANGHVTYSDYGRPGNVTVTLAGSTNTNLTFAAAAQSMSGAIVINKSVSTATVTLQSFAAFSSAGQDLTVASGVLDLSSHSLNVADVLTVSAPGSLICNGGTYTSTSLVMEGTIDCAGYAFNWKGGSGTNWNTAANWTGGVVPSNTKVAVFKDAYCGANCNATLTADPNVKGLRMLSGYSGTITHNAGIPLTLGTSGWTQNNGTFAGGNSLIDMNGDFLLSGGTFTSTSNTLRLRKNITFSTGTFVHNSGTVEYFTGGYNIAWSNTNFNNLNYVTSGAGYTQSGTAIVLGTLYTRNDSSWPTINGGTIEARGNVTIDSLGIYSWSRFSTLKVIVNGSANQTITGTWPGSISNLEIASTGGTVSLAGSINILQEYKYTSGAINAGTSSLNFVGQDLNPLVTPGPVHYNNVSLIGASSFSLGSDFLVDGDFSASQPSTDSQGIFGYNIIVLKNISFSGYGYGGSTNIKVAGSTNQTVSSPGLNGKIPNLEFASTGGTVTVNDICLGGTLLYTSGTVTVTPGSNLRVRGGSPKTINTPGINWVHFDNAYSGNVTLVADLLLSGNATLGDTNAWYISGSVMKIGGNISFIHGGVMGSTQIEMVGTNNATVSMANSGGTSTSNWTINKSGGATVTLASNIGLNSTGQSLTINSSNTLDMAGYNLTVNSNITNNGTLKRGNNPTCGTVSQGGSYSGSAAICP